MDYTLDETAEDIEFVSSDENRQLVQQLTARAGREILIATYDFDNRLYSNSEFVDTLSTFLRSHRNAHVHILVWHTSRASKEGHRLVELAQRLSSSIKIHEPDKVHANFIESFMVVDGTAYFRRPLADRFEGVASFHAPIAARELRERFIAMWERSTPSSEFRRLRI